MDELIYDKICVMTFVMTVDGWTDLWWYVCHDLCHDRWWMNPMMDELIYDDMCVMTFVMTIDGWIQWWMNLLMLICALVCKQRLIGDRYLPMMDLCTGVRELYLDDKALELDSYQMKTSALELGVRQIQVEDQDVDKIEWQDH